MLNIIERLNQIDRIIHENKYHSTEVVQHALDTSAERHYLFELLARNKFDREWFLILAKLDVFSIKNLPAPLVQSGNNGEEQILLPNWDVSWLIASAADFNLLSFDTEVNEILETIIDDYIKYCNDNTNRNNRPDWVIAESILKLPLERVTAKHYDFIKTHALLGNYSITGSDLIDNYFPRVYAAKNSGKLLELLDLLFSLRPTENSWNIKSYVDEYLLSQFVIKHAQSIFELLQSLLLDWLVEKITFLSEKSPYEFSPLGIISIAEDEQNWSNQSLSVALVDFLKICLQDSGVELKFDISLYIKNFLLKEISIFRRAAYNAINKNYSLLRTIFWTQENPLLDIDCKNEIFKLIKAHCTEFNDHEFKELFIWINGLDIGEYRIDKKEDQEKYVAYKKIEWLRAFDVLEGTRRHEVDTMIQHLKQVSEIEPTHPGYNSWHEIRSGSEFSENRILNQSLKDVIQRINNEAEWQGYNAYGIKRDLEVVIQERASEVIANLDLFLKLNFDFLYSLSNAFRELVGQKKEVEWLHYLKFVFRVLEERNDLWEEKQDENHEVSSFLGMIAWVIKDGAQKQKLLFTKAELQLSVKILLKIDENYWKPFNYLNTDKPFDIINSTRGKIYEALILVSLRLRDLSEDKKWDKAIEQRFTDRLADGSYLDEFYWTLGFYTPQINYLNSIWFKANSAKIFIENEKNDDYSLKGYLYFNPTLYIDLFQQLFSKYMSALKQYKDDGAYTKRLIEHSCYAYFHDPEPLPHANTLIDLIFDLKYHPQIKALVNTLYLQGRGYDLNRLREVWKRVIEFGKSNDSKESDFIVFLSSSFICFFPTIDEQLLELTQICLAKSQGSAINNDLIDYCLKLSESQATYSGKIFLLITQQNKADFRFRQEKIEKILTNLYGQGERDLANSIAIQLVQNEYYFAKDLYNTYS